MEFAEEQKPSSEIAQETKEDTQHIVNGGELSDDLLDAVAGGYKEPGLLEQLWNVLTTGDSGSIR